MRHLKLRFVATALLASFAALGARGASANDNDGQRDQHGRKPDPFTMAVFGDAPYGTTPTDRAQLDATPAFIAAINGDPSVSLVIHVGDIHSGKQYCTEAYDREVAALWSQFQDPLIYTPGDNEWSDCHKKAQGGGAYNAVTGTIDHVLDAAGQPVDYAGGDPAANLDLIRSIFFSQPGTALGGRRKRVVSQAVFFDRRYPSDRQYVENVMWVQNDVLFVTINLPGGSNNDEDVWYGAPSETATQTQERAARTGADLRWLDAAFAFARLARLHGMAIVAQADMWDPEKGAEHLTGYEPFVSKVAAGALAFAAPVLMLNGDSHVYLSDNPLAPSDPLSAMHPGYDVPNFHRVVVHGSTTPTEYLRLTVDARAAAPPGASTFGPFRWEQVFAP